MTRIASLILAAALLSGCNVTVTSTDPAHQAVMANALSGAGFTVNGAAPGSAVAAAAPGVVADGVYGDGVDGSIVVERGRFQYGIPGETGPWRPVSELRPVAPDIVVWQDQAFCAGPMPGPSYPGKYICTEFGYVSDWDKRKYVPTGERARPVTIPREALLGQWTCFNCSGTQTMNFYPDGTAGEASSYRGFSQATYRYEQAGGRAIVFEGGTDGARFVQYAEIREGELFLSDNPYDALDGRRYTRR